MLKMLGRLIGEDIELTWRPAASVWPVLMDPAQLDQVLTNLCVNARDAIDRGGTITIESGTATLTEADCAGRPGFIPGDFSILIVDDDGCGMDADTLANLFEPFFTTKGVGQGTGLGLAVVYGIVKQNNGFIDVSSEPGVGTIFRIYLRRHGGTMDPVRREPRTAPLGGGRETILLVEDEPALLSMASAMLGRLGYTVLAAATPGEAIRLAELHAGEIDLLMTDVVMPEMNGWDLARRLMALYPGLKRLFMSGYTASIIPDGVLDEGVPFLQKPFSQQNLAAALRSALDWR
jgi:CheY-like chemotaxis protein